MTSFCLQRHTMTAAKLREGTAAEDETGKSLFSRELAEMKAHVERLTARVAGLERRERERERRASDSIVDALAARGTSAVVQTATGKRDEEKEKEKDA